MRKQFNEQMAHGRVDADHYRLGRLCDHGNRQRISGYHTYGALRDSAGYGSAGVFSLPSKLTSSFKVTPPTSSAGLDHEYAYDVWLTSTSNPTAFNWDNDLELMIWTYVAGPTPAGSVAATLADGSKVWTDGDNSTGIVSVVLPQNKLSGTVNISGIISQLKARGYINSAHDGILDWNTGSRRPYGGGRTFTVDSLSVYAEGVNMPNS